MKTDDLRAKAHYDIQERWFAALPDDVPADIVMAVSTFFLTHALAYLLKQASATTVKAVLDETAQFVAERVNAIVGYDASDGC